MNLLLLSKDDFARTGPGRRAILKDRRHKHMLKVLKLSVGDELCVGLIGGLIGKGRVISIDGNTAEIETAFDTKPPKPLPCTLILALPRPIVLNRLLGHITALGVKRIVLIHTNRVEKSYWKSPVLREENIKAQLILGMEQAKDTMMPEVLFRTKFKPFVEDELSGIIKGTRAFVAHPEASSTLPCCVEGAKTLVIGPEGGFIPDEIESLEKRGCVCVNLGRRILRVETAVIAALSRLAPSS